MTGPARKYSGMTKIVFIHVLQNSHKTLLPNLMRKSAKSVKAQKRKSAKAQKAQPHDVVHRQASPINDIVVIKEVNSSHVRLHSLFMGCCGLLIFPGKRTAFWATRQSHGGQAVPNRNAKR
jgi:hypothetical protein